MADSRPLIVLTGASGKQCSVLIPHLAPLSSHKLRLVVNSTKSKERLEKAWPSAEVLKADLTVLASCTGILKGAAIVYHVGPPFHPRETEMGYNMIEAAQEESKNGDFKHFVYSSVLHTQIRKLMNHDCKRFVEERLLESSLKYTILNPTTFLNNMPIAMIAQQEKPIFPAPWNPDVLFSMLVLKDLGEASAKVILEGEKHYFADYALTSTWPISQGQVMKEAEKQLGKTIPVVLKSVSESTDMMWSRLYPDKELDSISRDGLERMILYYNRHGLLANPNTLASLLGRPPTDWHEFVKEQVDSVR